MDTSKIEDLAAELGYLLEQKNLKVATAESCTGGGIAFAITSVAGSSKWFEEGFVTYSNEAKTELLEVPQTTLTSYGAVSEQTVRAMVAGLARRTGADLCLAVSGVAGPGGGTADKPVGMVWLAWNYKGDIEPQCYHFEGGRSEVRFYAIKQALTGAIERVEADKSAAG